MEDNIATTPRQSSWKFLLTLFCASSLLEVAAWGHMEAFTPLYLERELGMPEADIPRWTGLLTVATLLVAAPLSPFWGVLADRYNRKIIILRTMIFGTLGYALAAFTFDVWQFLGVRMVLGMTFGANAIILAILSGVVPDRRMGLAFGLFQMILPAGKSIGPLLGSGLIGLFGLRGMFAADALLTLIAFGLVLLLYQEPPRRRDTSLGVFSRLATVTGVVWNTPTLRLNFFLLSLYAGGFWMITPFLPIAIDRAYDGEDVALVIGLVMAGHGVLASVAAPFAGRVADRLGAERVVVFCMAGFLVMSAGLVLAVELWQVTVAVLLGALPFGAANTALYTHLAQHTPRDHMGSVMGLTPMARNVAMLIGPTLGAIVSGFGLPAIFATAALGYVVGVATSLRLVKASAERARGER